MLLAKNLMVTLGASQILHDVSITAAPGEFTCIVGPNGSGKTTTLKALTGDVRYDGHITINNNDLAYLKPWELATIRGVLPQTSVLAFPFTVIEVVRIGLMTGADAQDGCLALQSLARVGLAHYADRFYQELSGGEQQRVQLARVLAQIPHAVGEDGPRWLFLDGPVSSLDIAHQLQIMSLAEQFARDGGGVIAVMHDLNLTAMFADQIILMANGRILQAGPPSVVLTDANLSQAYGCDVKVGMPPPAGIPYVLPHAARHTGLVATKS